MNYEHYRIFYLVGQYRNITKAAEVLLTSQPAVTRVIHSMEAELGCQLFIRSKNGVEFTREGRALYEMLEAPCHLLDRVDHDIKKSAGWNMETIHIGTTATALQCFLFDFLADFRREQKNINIMIHTGSSSQMIARLKSGEIDLVFNTTPFSRSKEFSVIPVLSFRDILVAGNAFHELKGRTISLRELTSYPFILLTHGMSYRTFCDNFLEENDVPITPAIEADSSGLIIPMVEHNWGIGFAPEDMTIDSINKGNMFRIELIETIPERHVTLVFDPHRPTTNVVRSLFKRIERISKV